MKISLHIHAGRSIQEVIEVTKFLDKNNWYAAYVSDHFMHHKNHVKNGNILECWTTLATIASATHQIKIGSLVSPISFRHPGILTNMATTVDEVSKGRLILGVGAGWQENEHDSYGFELLNPANRIDRLEEGLSVIKGLLSEKQFSFSGKYFNFKKAICEPKKFINKIPIMIGCWSGNPRMLRVGEKYGDIINFIASSEELKNKITPELIENNNIHKNVLMYPFIVDSMTESILRKYLNLENKNPYSISVFSNYSLLNKQKLINEIESYRQLGINEVILGDMSFLTNDELFLILTYLKNIIDEI